MSERDPAKGRCGGKSVEGGRRDRIEERRCDIHVQYHYL